MQRGRNRRLSSHLEGGYPEQLWWKPLETACSSRPKFHVAVGSSPPTHQGQTRLQKARLFCQSLRSASQARPRTLQCSLQPTLAPRTTCQVQQRSQVTLTTLPDVVHRSGDVLASETLSRRRFSATSLRNGWESHVAHTATESHTKT